MLSRMSSRHLSEWMAYFTLKREDHDEVKTDRELANEAAAGLKKRIKRQRGH